MSGAYDISLGQITVQTCNVKSNQPHQLAETCIAVIWFVLPSPVGNRTIWYICLEKAILCIATDRAESTHHETQWDIIVTGQLDK